MFDFCSSIFDKDERFVSISQLPDQLWGLPSLVSIGYQDTGRRVAGARSKPLISI
jgi:hypothetical protein